MGFESHIIAKHLMARRSYFGGFPIDRFVFEGRKGVAKEIEAGRFRPRGTRRPREELFRSPTDKVTLPGFGRRENKPSIFPGIGKRQKPRVFSRRV